MNVCIKIYPAKNGDCFLLSFGRPPAISKHLIIDCGFSHTVENYLKHDILEITAKAESIERLILTHIDADHIQGAIRLLKDNNKNRFIEINEVWFNSYRHLFDKTDIITKNVQERTLKQIIQRGYPKSEIDINPEMISAEQGTTVGALILQGKYAWNNDFGGKAVCIEQKQKIDLDENSSIFLLSPNRKKLESLKTHWKEELERYGSEYNYQDSGFLDDAFEMLLSWEKDNGNLSHKEISAERETIDELLKQPFSEDKTVTNGSSIAFIIHILNKRLLFLADSHPDIIVGSLNIYQSEGIIMFDLIKVSHHGSVFNISRELLEKIDSQKFVFSTNGSKHNHPDKATISHIISRKANFKRELYFNYKTNTSQFFERKDWMETYNYSIHYIDKAPYSLIV